MLLFCQQHADGRRIDTLKSRFALRERVHIGPESDRRRNPFVERRELLQDRGAGVLTAALYPRQRLAAKLHAHGAIGQQAKYDNRYQCTQNKKRNETLTESGTEDELRPPAPIRN